MEKLTIFYSSTKFPINITLKDSASLCLRSYQLMLSFLSIIACVFLFETTVFKKRFIEYKRTLRQY